jgi:hypothetical protein
MKSTPSPPDLYEDQEVIQLLKNLACFRSEYPPELLAARRGTFIAQVDQREKTRSTHQVPSKNGFIQRPDE